MAGAEVGDQGNKPRIVVVIVDYFKAEQVAEALACLNANDYPRDLMDFVIVDNSVDGNNADKLRRLEVQYSTSIEISPINLGYAKACNKGACMKDSDYILLLNPDVCLRNPASIRRLVEFLEEHPKAAICGPRQINPDGGVAETARRFPSFLGLLWRRIGGTKNVSGKVSITVDHTATQVVDWLQSSCLLVRRSFWDRVGGLDERYFLFMSDIEICLEAWRAGQTVHFLSDVEAFPDGIRASRGGFLALFYSRPFRLHVLDALRFFRRHGLGEYRR